LGFSINCNDLYDTSKGLNPSLNSNYFVKNPIYYSRRNPLKGGGFPFFTKIGFQNTGEFPKGSFILRGGIPKRLHF